MGTHHAQHVRLGWASVKAALAALAIGVTIASFAAAPDGAHAGSAPAAVSSR